MSVTSSASVNCGGLPIHRPVARPEWPPIARHVTEVRRSVPAVSRTTSNNPSSVGDTVRWSAAWWAPSVRTKSRLAARARAVTSAPYACPSWTAALPTPPAAPRTSSRSPGLSAALSRRAVTAVVATGSAAAATRSSPSGTRPSRSGRTVTYSAGLPNPELRPRAPHTRSPTATPVVPVPSAAISPVKSSPMRCGNFRPVMRRSRPERAASSAPFTLNACTRTRTSPGAGPGRGTRLTYSTSGPPKRSNSTALIVRSSIVVFSPSPQWPCGGIVAPSVGWQADEIVQLTGGERESWGNPRGSRGRTVCGRTPGVAVTLFSGPGMLASSGPSWWVARVH